MPQAEPRTHSLQHITHSSRLSLIRHAFMWAVLSFEHFPIVEA